MGPPFFCPPQRMPPLCKGRWHGAAVTEGLLALDFPPRQNRCRRGGHCPPAFLRPHSSLSLFGERKEPPQRQKKPAPFRFRRGGESSIFAASFFLPESRPLRWVAFRLLLEKKENLRNWKCKPFHHHVTAQLSGHICPPQITLRGPTTRRTRS